MATTAELIDRLRKGANCVYLAAEEGPANDLSDMLTQAAAALARVAELETAFRFRDEQLLDCIEQRNAALARVAALEAEMVKLRWLAELQAQLPDGMKHCTILFRECALGHGWLTATNWVQLECPTCRLRTIQAETWEQAATVAGEWLDNRQIRLGPLSGPALTAEFRRRAQAAREGM